MKKSNLIFEILREKKGKIIFLIFEIFMKNMKIMQCMKFLDQNNECMQECYECQDEHQEHIFEKFFNARKTCKTPNLEFFNAYALRIQECI